MIKYAKSYRIQPQWKDQRWAVVKADIALKEPIPHITDAHSENSEGGLHDYYSNGDYWWPDPDTRDGLPYVQRDGQTNPNNFNEHRIILRHMRSSTVFLTTAWDLTKDERYAKCAVQILKEFFLDEDTKMNPNLNYAQAIPGICPGRGIGIIDTLHLADVVFVTEKLRSRGAMGGAVYKGLRKWFAAYLDWMMTSKNGMDEMQAANNHSVCFFVQAAVFALFTDNKRIVDFCREQYKHVLLKQMAADGSFPLELARTKPYSYSIFVLDNMVTLCHLLSKPDDNLWKYQAESGQGIIKGLEYITPYILDKSSWPYKPDVMHDDAFPARASFMVFAGWTLGNEILLTLYESLPIDILDEEARRNIAIRQPMLWV